MAKATKTISTRPKTANGTSKPRGRNGGRPRLSDPAHLPTARKSITLRISDDERSVMLKAAGIHCLDLTRWLRWTAVQSAKDQIEDHKQRRAEKRLQRMNPESESESRKEPANGEVKDSREAIQ